MDAVFRVTRESDGKRVERKVPIGLAREFPSKGSAWKEVERQQVAINKPNFRKQATFAELAQHYIEHELGECLSAILDPKAHTTVAAYKRVLRNRLLPRWGKQIAVSIQPLEIEGWLSKVKHNESLENPTLDKMRRVMSLVYKHGQRHGLIPRREECNPLRFVRCKTTSDYEAKTLSPQAAFSVLMRLPEPERTLTLLAASTGLRISECLGLQWQDIDSANAQIRVLRTWTCGQVGAPKSKASKAPVPLHPLLAEFMSLAQPDTIPTTRRRGFSESQAEWEETASCKHAGRGLSPSRSRESRNPIGRRSLPFRISQPATLACFVFGSHQNGSKDGASTLAAFRRQDHLAAVCAQRPRRSNAGAGQGASGHFG